VFLISTYTDGTPPESAKWFCQWLLEAVDDFRVQKSLLSGVKFAVFGLGNSLYGDCYNAVGKNLFDGLSKLSGTPVCSLGLGDENVSQSIFGGEKSSYLYLSLVVV
jgi:tRNA wybutosine-synthesizing protein 1